ncbi:MAG: organic solvent tolerance protein OstA [Proteobacteria bacterium]|nr:organic solvent tolerance protein OstA [Pseudomonadota bacterium]
MKNLFLRSLLSFGLVLAVGAAEAQNTKAKRGTGTPFAGFGGNSKEPIKIDANKLEVFDKENRAVYSGDVVSVQGQSTLRCSAMTIHYTGGAGRKGAEAPKADEPAKTGQSGGVGGNSIKQIDCQGPVSLVSGTMSATSRFMTYDAVRETATFTGQVVIIDCENVQRGERAVYDVKSGRATVDAGSGGRVQGVFTPGGDEKKKSGSECAGKRG